MQIANDNTFSVTTTNAYELLQPIKTNAYKCLEWFKLNKTTANPSKFQAIANGIRGHHIDKFEIKNWFTVIQDSHVTILGVETDKKLQLDTHIAKYVKSSQAVNFP